MNTRLDSTSFLYGANGAFIEDLYSRYLEDPTSVDASWLGFFADLGDDLDAVLAEARGATWAPKDGGAEPELAEAFGLAAAPPRIRSGR